MLHHSLTAKDPKHRLDLWRLIDRLDEVGLTGLQIDPSHFKLVPGDDEAALKRLASIRDAKGYYFEFGMGGWDVPRMIERIKLTARFGGGALRTFVSSENASQEDLAKWVKMAAPALREAGKTAEEYNVRIAVENHGDFTSVQLKELIDMAGHPRVGVCLDTGNSLFRKEDPLECAKRLAPYTYSMHLKDWFMSHTPDGKPHWKGAVLGEGTVPVFEILKLVAEHHTDLYIALENPIHPVKDEVKTVAREWQHLVASAAAANRMLAEL